MDERIGKIEVKDGKRTVTYPEQTVTGKPYQHRRVDGFPPHIKLDKVHFVVVTFEDRGDIQKEVDALKKTLSRSASSSSTSTSTKKD